MTGYQSKKAMAQDKLDSMERKRGSIALARQLCYEIAGATNGDDDFSGNDYGSVDIAKILSAEVVRLQAALAQPAQEPVAWADLVKEAQQIVKSKFLWKKFIDGTPLANDIAFWMADFAQQYTAPPQRTWVDLTPALKAKERLIRIMGTFDLATGHADTFDELLDSLKSELRDVLGHYREALAQPAQERNFCERCGKRTADLTTIHTCTPPQEKNNAV